MISGSLQPSWFEQGCRALIASEFATHLIGILKNNHEKENDLVATSCAERGIACHFLIDGLEARPTILHYARIFMGYSPKTFENYYMLKKTGPESGTSDALPEARLQ